MQVKQLSVCRACFSRWVRCLSWAIAALAGLCIGCLGGIGNAAIALPVHLPSATPAASPLLAEPAGDRLDLEQAADAAERASDQIYAGIKATKRKIGKTAGRKEAIQTARDRASHKWQSLAEKARAAQQDPNIDLSPVERRNLQRLKESQP